MNSEPEQDLYNCEAYAQFVASMVKYCHCDERYRPCDSVLAGGPCEHIEDTRDYDDEST